jgi:hypothetical protein
VLLASFAAAPAIGASVSNDHGVQPSGTVDADIGPLAPVPAQPPADAPAIKVTKVAPVPQQPANLHPEPAGASTTVVDKSDKGRKNLPVRKDLGDR